MIQGEIELSDTDIQTIYTVMQNEAFVSAFTKVLMVREQQAFEELLNSVVTPVVGRNAAGNPTSVAPPDFHASSRYAGYLSCLNETLTGLSDVAKRYLQGPP